MIVSDGCASVIAFCAIAQLYVRTLIRERRAGMHLHETTHGVSSVECPLRTTENVDAFDVIEVEVEGTLVEERDVVHIHAHSWGIDTRTDATDVHSRSEARAIVGHKEIRHDVARALERSDTIGLHVLL